MNEIPQYDGNRITIRQPAIRQPGSHPERIPDYSGAPHPGNPSNMTHPIINVLGCAAVAFVLITAATLLLAGCASLTCPACAPLVVCEPWINPLGDGGAPGADAGVDAAPAPSGSANP